MAASTRHLQRHNLATAVAPAANEAGDPKEEPLLPRARQRRASTAAAADDLSDETSEMARFLLVGSGQGSCGWFSRFRRDVSAADDRVDGQVRSMWTFKGEAYSLALEPIEIGSEKIVMLSEAYAIFGGLFLGGTWVLYEWGSPNSEDEDVGQFAVVMAIAICCNIFLALWSSVLWIRAILYGSREGFVLQARKLLAFCNFLLWITLIFVTLGVGAAVRMNFKSLSLDGAEGVVLVIVGYLQLTGAYYVADLDFSVSPLACYHTPTWYRAIVHPLAVFTYNGRKKLRERAKAEAERLKCGAYGNKSEQDDETDSSMSTLLRTAASNLGRNDNIATYVARLREDWFNDAEQLKHRSAEFLSRYMPFLLAEEVQKLAGAEYSG